MQVLEAEPDVEVMITDVLLRFDDGIRLSHRARALRPFLAAYLPPVTPRAPPSSSRVVPVCYANLIASLTCYWQLRTRFLEIRTAKAGVLPSTVERHAHRRDCTVEAMPKRSERHSGRPVFSYPNHSRPDEPLRARHGENAQLARLVEFKHLPCDAWSPVMRKNSNRPMRAQANVRDASRRAPISRGRARPSPNDGESLAWR
jgi:hypothetical protein